MLIGITGTNGAGKGAVVEYLVAAKGFSQYSARTVILDEIHNRHLPEDKETMREVANDLRKEHGSSYIIERLYELAKGDSSAVIESVRTIGEAEFLKKLGARIIAVDGDKKLRFERIAQRDDGKAPDFETFSDIEDREMASADPWDMNVFGVMQLADARIENNGTLEELHAAVDAALHSFAAT
jgi:dephospho-CoA kinase